MYNAGLSPECTPDPRRAFHLWSSDGAVILTTNHTDVAEMLAGARDVFGPRILVHQSPTTVAGNTRLPRPSDLIPARRADIITNPSR
ncbi:MAG: hypothetical protein ACRDS9_27275 [Pseudonocardiaceae bacterium]